MHVLVAGAAGFIGSHLATRLVADGHRVIGVDNLSTGRRQNVADLVGRPEFELWEADVCEPLAIEEPLDWILHFASPASPPKYLELTIETLRVNAEGTYALLELARRTGAGLLLASTSEVYGDPEIHPQVEGYWGHVNPIGPRSVYDEGKRYAEAMVTAYGQRHGLPTRIVRIFNTYGPGMDPWDGRVITNFLVQAVCGEPLTVYGDGMQTRSFQYIDDLVEGVMQVLACEYEGPVNIGNPNEFTILELARLVNELTGNQSGICFEELPHDDPRQRRPDISLARRLLGWEPRVALRQGLERTLDALPAPVALMAVAVA
jgi:dTDP-glucose 4,6-dehydratase